MKLIYNLVIYLINLLVPIAYWFGGKTRLFVQGQQSIDYDALAKWRTKFSKVIWFHCASLGEFEQGRPVLELFRKRHPDYGILLSFFSPSGYEVRKNYDGADYITYLPLDQPSKVRNFVKAAQPDLVVFVKYEFWPNIINEIKKSGAKLIGISVIFRPGQAFFKPWGGFFRKILKQFDFLFVQNEQTARLLDKINYTSYDVVGDTRFDRVIATAEQEISIPKVEKFLNKKSKVMVVGSAWPEDMEVLKPFIITHPEMKFIIAPHEINEDQINQWKTELQAVLYSEFEAYTHENVLIINSIGLLSRLYKYADYTFVGGGYKTGLHNILEPAVFGTPIFFGDKKYEKFQEAIDLIDLKVAFPIRDNLDDWIKTVDLEEIKALAANYVKKNQGATDKIIDHLTQNA